MQQNDGRFRKGLHPGGGILSRLHGRNPAQSQLLCSIMTAAIPEIALLTLKTAIARAFPAGGMSEKCLRREAKAGRLKIYRIGRKDYTTLKDIDEMKELYLAP